MNFTHLHMLADTGGITDTFPNFANVLGALSKIVVLSLCLERVFAFLFEWDWIKGLLEKKPDMPDPLKPGATETRVPIIKAALPAVTAWIICNHYDFDVIQVLFAAKVHDSLGVLLTSLIAAGGSSGAIALFQGVLGFSKEARDAQNAAKQATSLAEQKKAEATIMQSDSDKAKAALEKEKAEQELKKLKT